MEKTAQVILLLIAVIISQLTLRYLSKKNQGSLTKEESKLKGIELFCLLKKKNLLGCVLIEAIFIVLINAPLIEELIFRVPLLMGFAGFNYWTWPAIIVSAAIFGWVHYDSRIMRRCEAFIWRKKMEELPPQVFYGNAGRIKVVVCFLLGIFLGWLAVNTQNIFWSIIVHSGYNLFFAVGIGVFLVAVWLLILVTTWAYKKGKEALRCW